MYIDQHGGPNRSHVPLCKANSWSCRNPKLQVWVVEPSEKIIAGSVLGKLALK